MYKTLYNTQCGGCTIACLPINLGIVVNNCLVADYTMFVLACNVCVIS